MRVISCDEHQLCMLLWTVVPLKGRTQTPHPDWNKTILYQMFCINKYYHSHIKKNNILRNIDLLYCNRYSMYVPIQLKGNKKVSGWYRLTHCKLQLRSQGGAVFLRDAKTCSHPLDGSRERYIKLVVFFQFFRFCLSHVCVFFSSRMSCLLVLVQCRKV